MAKVEQFATGEKKILLNKDESAIVFGDEGIYQLLSETFRDILLEAQETHGQSILETFDKATSEDASKVINDFVLIQVVNLLADITESLRNKDLRAKK
jgi:hypothetical protein